MVCSCFVFLQEVDEEDEQAFELFMSKHTPARRTLADVIMEKIQDKKTEIESQMSGMYMYLEFCKVHNLKLLTAIGVCEILSVFLL